MRANNFYHDQPLFGLDFGFSSLKVMQIQKEIGKKPKVLGYGVVDYPHDAIQNGIVAKSELLEKALYDLFTKKMVGSINTRRVACTIPTSRTFSRPMKVPLTSKKDIQDAVILEAEQYIPIPRAELYIDYEILSKQENSTELVMVATPKNIIDSHIKLLESVGLEVIALEPTMNASARIFSMADPSQNEPSILIDFGSVAVDLAVMDKNIFVNSTVVGGSEDIAWLIARQLRISREEALNIKNTYGIAVSDRQDQIKKIIRPILDNLLKEIQKIIRYYDDRKTDKQRKIGQIVTFGGGSKMPGLSALLNTELKLQTRLLDPWDKIDFGVLRQPDDVERSIYVTVAGEAFLNPKEILP